MGKAAPSPDVLYDRELGDLPAQLRWREWMGRVEAAIFAAAAPVPREALARLVGRDCRLEDLIADIREELKGRPYDLVPVAGPAPGAPAGWQHRTRPRFAAAIRLAAGPSKDADLSAMTPTEGLVVTAIAYLQPVTRAALSRLAGREISRDVIAKLKQLGLIASGPRSPTLGAPLTYVTTGKFLSLFGLGSLRDLPDREAIEEAGLLDHEAEGAADPLDALIGLGRDSDEEEADGADAGRDEPLPED
jgi:segregation and condensation protein B